MRRRYVWIILGLILLLAACSGGNQEPTPEATDTAADDSPTAAPALATVPPIDSEYPGPETPAGYPQPGSEELAPGPALSEGYPAPPEPLPTDDPYPGGLAIIQHPAGIQCEDPLFPDVETAVNVLEQAGITVEKAEEVELVVCSACNCPTSLHYRVFISPADLDAALSMSWERGY